MNMIKSTRQKFMAITIAAISLVLILILGMLNIGVFGGIYFSVKENIEIIRERRGFVFNKEAPEIFPDEPSDNLNDVIKSVSKVSYMYVRISNNRNGTPLITTNMNDTYSADTIYYIAKTFADTGHNTGLFGNMLFDVERSDLYTTVIIIDISKDIGMMKNLLISSLIIILLSIVFVSVFTYFLSKWAIRPVQTAFENQQRFISDASHELKTPLTVISANADVLESEIGENKWLSNIKTQSVIMNELVHDLLNLAKLDETRDDMLVSEFDLSSVVLSKALEFECTAFEQGKTFEQNIADSITYKGNEDSIKHLVTILIDNAIRHSDDKGIIRVSLATIENRPIFQVFNTGNGIKNSEKDKIFNRFYRSDESRSRVTGGYGLGLAIAKSITDAHNGTISVDGEENKWVSFTVIL